MATGSAWWEITYPSTIRTLIQTVLLGNVAVLIIERFVRGGLFRRVVQAERRAGEIALDFLDANTSFYLLPFLPMRARIAAVTMFLAFMFYVAFGLFSVPGILIFGFFYRIYLAAADVERARRRGA